MPLAERGAAAAADSGWLAFRKTRPWPGSITPQPNAPSVKRAKAMALRTGSLAEIRVTAPSLRSLATTEAPTADGGPST